MKSAWLALCLLPPLSALASGATYELDPLHTYPSLEFSHMGISVWRGKFTKSSGTLKLNQDKKSGKVEVQIDPASIDFGLAAMDEKARSDDFMNVAKYPKASYRGTLKWEGDTLKRVEGKLTFMGKTKPLTLTVNSFKCIQHPFYKKEVCGADAEGDMNWGEWGMKQSQWGQGEAGKLHLRIQVEGIRKD